MSAATRAERDHALVKRAQNGDTAAFQVLVETYSPDAFSLACSIVKDSDLAEDILQESFIKVFDKIGTFRFRSSFYTWLYRIVVNRCYNALRSQKPKDSLQEEPPSEPEAAASLTNRNDLKAVVNEALNQMKPDEALLLRLYYLSELSIEEVMKVTGFKQSKVKVTLHRGRKRLAQILERTLGAEIDNL